MSGDPSTAEDSVAQVDVTPSPAVFVTATQSADNDNAIPTATAPPPTAIPPSATVQPSPTLAPTLAPVPAGSCVFHTDLERVPLSGAPLSNILEIAETTLTPSVAYPILQSHFEHFNIVVDDSAGWVDRRAGTLDGDCASIPEDETSLRDYATLCWFASNVNQPTYGDPDDDSIRIASVEAGHSYVVLQRHPDGFYLLYYDHAFSAWVDANAGQLSGDCDDLTSPGAIIAEARVWSEPNVNTGAVLATLSAGTDVRIVSQPTRGPIRLDTGEEGDWHRVQTTDRDVTGWVWVGVLAFD